MQLEQVGLGEPSTSPSGTPSPSPITRLRSRSAGSTWATRWKLPDVRSRHPRDDGQRRDRGEHPGQLEHDPAADLRAGDDEHDPREHGSRGADGQHASRGAAARATAPTTRAPAARSTTRRAPRPGAGSRPRRAPRCRARPSRARAVAPAGRRGSPRRAPAPGSSERPARAAAERAPHRRPRAAAARVRARRTVVAASPTATSTATARSLTRTTRAWRLNVLTSSSAACKGMPRCHSTTGTPLRQVRGPQRLPAQLPEPVGQVVQLARSRLGERHRRDLDHGQVEAARPRSISARAERSSSSGVSASTSARGGSVRTGGTSMSFHA